MNFRDVSYLPMTFETCTKTFRFNPFGAIIFGHGVIKDIGKEILKAGFGNVFIVSDKGLRKAGIISKVEKPLRDEGVKYKVYDEVEQNPSADTVNKIAKIAIGYDLIIGLGGGSSIDAAKGASIVITNGGKIEDYDSWGGVKKNTLPMFAIPTTAGSGAEVTPWAVITDKKRGWKMAIGSPYIIPSLAICDPDLTLSLPRYTTAATGMDALTHAIESYTSCCNQPISESLSLKAIELIGKNLRVAVARGDANREARYNMLLGASMAAMAHSNTVCGICHGMAHPLGALFHIDHGTANAMCLPVVMEYNQLADPNKFKKIAVAMGENVRNLSLLKAAERATVAVNNLKNDIDIPNHLRDFGVKEEDISSLAEEAMKSPDRAMNARSTTKEDFVRLYKKIF